MGWKDEDRWISSMFEKHPQLQLSLQVLVIAVDHASKKFGDHIALIHHEESIEDIGRRGEYDSAVEGRDWDTAGKISDEASRHSNYMGVLKGTRSLERWCPALVENVYWGRYKHGGYAIFSRGALVEVVEPVGGDDEKEKLDVLFPVRLSPPRTCCVAPN